MTVPCYTSLAEKIEVFPRVVIPQVYGYAVAGADDGTLRDWLDHYAIQWIPRGVAQLLCLHYIARQGLYKQARPYNCDPPQLVADTIQNGGDCDQWATVILAALIVMGYPGRLVTFGSDADPFEHVAVGAKAGGAWYFLDPKGDQGGLDFGAMDSNFPNFQVWDAPPELD